MLIGKKLLGEYELGKMLLSLWRERENNKTSSKLVCSGVDGLWSCAISGLVAQRITRLTTDQKIAGSNPAEIDLFHIFIFFLLIARKVDETH